MGLVGVIGLDAFYASYIESQRIPRVVSALKHGSAELDVLGKSPYFSRAEDETQVKPLVSPDEGGFFNLITGEHGTGTVLTPPPRPSLGNSNVLGKTTLVRHVCHTVGSGVVYTRVPEDTSQLARDVSSAVSFDLDTHLSFWQQIRRRWLPGTISLFNF